MGEMQVWVVLSTADDGTDSGYRYVSGVFDSEEKANAYADSQWGFDVDGPYRLNSP